MTNFRHNNDSIICLLLTIICDKHWCGSIMHSYWRVLGLVRITSHHRYDIDHYKRGKSVVVALYLIEFCFAVTFIRKHCCPGCNDCDRQHTVNLISSIRKVTKEKNRSNELFVRGFEMKKDGLEYLSSKE